MKQPIWIFIWACLIGVTCASCPGNCSYHGTCNGDGTCSCDFYWSDPDCSLSWRDYAYSPGFLGMQYSFATAYTVLLVLCTLVLRELWLSRIHGSEHSTEHGATSAGHCQCGWLFQTYQGVALLLLILFALLRAVEFWVDAYCFKDIIPLVAELVIFQIGAICLLTSTFTLVFLWIDINVKILSDTSLFRRARTYGKCAIYIYAVGSLAVLIAACFNGKAFDHVTIVVYDILLIGFLVYFGVNTCYFGCRLSRRLEGASTQLAQIQEREQRLEQLNQTPPSAVNTPIAPDIPSSTVVAIVAPNSDTANSAPPPQLHPSLAAQTQHSGGHPDEENQRHNHRIALILRRTIAGSMFFFLLTVVLIAVSLPLRLRDNLDTYLIHAILLRCIEVLIATFTLVAYSTGIRRKRAERATRETKISQQGITRKPGAGGAATAEHSTTPARARITVTIEDASPRHSRAKPSSEVAAASIGAASVAATKRPSEPKTPQQPTPTTTPPSRNRQSQGARSSRDVRASNATRPTRPSDAAATPTASATPKAAGGTPKNNGDGYTDSYIERDVASSKQRMSLVNELFAAIDQHEQTTETTSPPSSPRSRHEPEEVSSVN